MLAAGLSLVSYSVAPAPLTRPADVVCLVEEQQTQSGSPFPFRHPLSDHMVGSRPMG